MLNNGSLYTGIVEKKLAARALFIKIFIFYFKVWYLSSISSSSISIQIESWARSRFRLSHEFYLNSDWVMNWIWIQIESWTRSEFLNLNLNSDWVMNSIWISSVSIWIQIEILTRSQVPQSQLNSVLLTTVFVLAVSNFESENLIDWKRPSNFISLHLALSKMQ